MCFMCVYVRAFACVSVIVFVCVCFLVCACDVCFGVFFFGVCSRCMRVRVVCLFRAVGCVVVCKCGCVCGCTSGYAWGRL